MSDFMWQHQKYAGAEIYVVTNLARKANLQKNKAQTIKLDI